VAKCSANLFLMATTYKQAFAFAEKRQPTRV
jgi:hypothetical protein